MSQLISVAGELQRREAGGVEAVFDRRSSCASCIKSSACGARSFPGQGHHVDLASTGVHGDSGATVAAVMPAGRLVLLAATGYLLPALLCVICAWLATLLVPVGPDAAALLGAGCGLILSAAAIRRADIDSWVRGCVRIRVSAGSGH